MLRVGGWDGTAGKRGRGCQRVHVRHGQEYATGAGVTWQGQGMLAISIWRVLVFNDLISGLELSCLPEKLVSIELRN